MTVYPDHATTEPLPELQCRECLAVAQLAARLEGEAYSNYTDHRVDAGVVAHRIRVALGLVQSNSGDDLYYRAHCTCEECVAGHA